MATHTIDEGFDPHTGIRTRVHFEDGHIVYQKTFDAQPYLEHAAQLREATQGQRWGDGKIIGTIPPAFHGQLQLIKDPKERTKALMEFFRENPDFTCFDKALK